MQSNRLQLNTSKSEVLWCSSVRRQHLIPDTPLIVGVDAVLPARSVCHLAIYIDSDVSVRINVAKTASSCFCALRQIRSIRRIVSKHVLLSLVVAMVLARLDYGSATLASLPDLLFLASFSMCSTLPRDWSSLVVTTTTLRHCSVICTGCRFRSASRFVGLCLPIGANMVWHRHICQPISTASQMSTAVGDFDPHRRQRCLFHARSRL